MTKTRTRITSSSSSFESAGKVVGDAFVVAVRAHHRMAVLGQAEKAEDRLAFLAEQGFGLGRLDALGDGLLRRRGGAGRGSSAPPW